MEKMSSILRITDQTCSSKTNYMQQTAYFNKYAKLKIQSK